jgi:regulatory protein YycI of two-component signal transduction system YycFG
MRDFMEWSKTKNILIVALLITNLIIGYFIWNKDFNYEKIDENSRVMDMVAILNDQGIDIRDLKTLKIETMPVIYAAFIGYELDELAPQLLREGQYESVYNNNGVQGYIDGEYRLSLINQYTIKLEKIIDSETEQNLIYPTVDAATEIAATFIRQSMHFDDDFEFSKYELLPTGMKITYTQTFSNYFIEGSYMSVIINNNSVIDFERKWFLVSDEEERISQLSPYSIALYRLLEVVPEEDIKETSLKIEKVSIGYSLKGTIFNTDILSGEASPYYKFVSSEGKTYMVEALQVE